MKNPFKKKGLATTMVASLVAGAGSVGADYVISQIDALSNVDQMYIDGGKVVAGALLGSMTKNQYVKSIADGMATVGAAALVQSLIDGTSTSNPTSGLPKGTIGRVQAGDRYFRNGGKRNNNNGFTVSSAFISK